MVEITTETAQPIADASQNAVDAVNPLLNILPVEIWVVVATALVAALGWFGKTAFDWWRESRLPYKQDRERYQAVINAVNPEHLHYFREIPLSTIGSIAVDGVVKGYEVLTTIRKCMPKYLHRKLTPLENELSDSLGELYDFLPLKLFPHHANGNVYTMYWDNFDEWSDEHHKRFQSIKDDLMNKIDRSIRAYEVFRDVGNDLFADKLVAEKSNG
ncbi:hypothetical protein [Sneathiella litorea]|uniref:Uncharacterized protein n=1 Tax=Sneathiella litorea TaxID=2606216 RepID=A0A6L8WAI8_9PROT|nr:hypothetical protein [Sneathiella litorea]MZR31460.1 hypothetical protein [Sneathiella litorea]